MSDLKDEDVERILNDQMTRMDSAFRKMDEVCDRPGSELDRLMERISMYGAMCGPHGSPEDAARDFEALRSALQALIEERDAALNRKEG